MTWYCCCLVTYAKYQPFALALTPRKELASACSSCVGMQARRAVVEGTSAWCEGEGVTHKTKWAGGEEGGKRGKARRSRPLKMKRPTAHERQHKAQINWGLGISKPPNSAAHVSYVGMGGAAMSCARAIFYRGKKAMDKPSFVTNYLPFEVTLNLKWIMSPSSTTYVFPSCLYLPLFFTSPSVPSSFKSAYFITSAQMKPLSKSV